MFTQAHQFAKRTNQIVAFEPYANCVPNWLIPIIGWIIYIITTIIGIIWNADFSATASYSGKWFIELVVAPILETFLIQYLVIELINVISRVVIKEDFYLLGLVLSVVFWVYEHSYSLDYMIYSSIDGLMLAITYIIFCRRKNRWFAFLMVYLLHSFINLTAQLYDLIF